MKKTNYYGLIIIAGIMTFMACGTSSTGVEKSDAVLMRRSEVQDYILSKHNQSNNLVYFFIKKEKQNENAYALIITDQMNKSDMMQCLVDYSMTRDVPGFRVTEESAYWYNYYSPVAIQDDYRGVSLAAFSLPKDIKEIWILVQNITINGNQGNIQSYPFIPFELNETSSQYYLINASAENIEKVISSIDHAEMEKYLSRTTFYATQTGTKFQLGYITGKGQSFVPFE
jgi:hypothetical protein